MATTAVEIVVPDGCSAGMEFTVEWGDTSYNITVPDGVAAGQLLTIELPALGEETAATHPTGGMQPVEIVVPDGCTPGMEFTVEWGGVSYSIAVPEGVWPGQPLTIELPELPAEPALGAPSIQEEEEEEDRVPEAAGEHYVGKEIKVLRSNGEYGPATIVEYNYAVENYTVDLGGGLLKYGVESGSIAEADFVAKLAGAFKVGARVMVPHLACFVTGRDPEREDVSGAITGYTSSTRYEVLLDNGTTKRYIWAHQIRVERKRSMRSK